MKEENKKKDTALLAYQEQNMLLNEEILELNGRRKCEVMQASFHAAQTQNSGGNRKYSEASDTSLIESFLIEDDEENSASIEDDSEFVLVADQEAPDTETCVWEETISGIKVLIFSGKFLIISHHLRTTTSGQTIITSSCSSDKEFHRVFVLESGVH